MINEFVYTKICLFLNGKPPKFIPDINLYKKILASNGASIYLDKNNISYDFVVGDMDSINNKKLYYKNKDKIIIDNNQNITDFEKSLKFIVSQSFFYVDVFGACGNMMDHFLGNINVALKYKNKISIAFYDDYCRFFFVKKQIKIENIIKGKKISLFPCPIVTNISTLGLKYNLYQENISMDKKIGIRNIATSNIIEISYATGNLLLFIEL